MEGEDRISALPDGILCHILSFLPTRDTIATGRLSKRWRPLWYTVPVIDIHLDDQTYLRNGCIYSPFLNFAYAALLLRNTQQPLMLARLRINTRVGPNYTFPEAHLNIWVKAVLERGLQHLHLEMPRYLSLTSIVFNCRTLVVLKLHRVSVDILQSVDLPALKTLYLNCVRARGTGYVSMILHRCPVLEELKVNRTNFGITEYHNILTLMRADVGFDFGIEFPLRVVSNVQVLRYFLEPMCTDYKITKFCHYFTTDNGMLALMNEWQNTPHSWVGSNPCGGWEGIGCSNTRIISISLASMGLSGQLTSDIGSLTELEILDLSYNNNLTGPLPSGIGNLRKLKNLSLNLNDFSGTIPAAIGNLSNLYWLDLADNRLEGPIPISNGTTPGLDMMHHTKHFHFGGNKLNGSIPSELFSSEMTLIHVLFESNLFTGSIPSTLGLVKSLEVVRLDGNFLSGNLPSNINNLTRVSELLLSNNRFSGPLPNLIGMNLLTYLVLRNNRLNGTLDIGTSISNNLVLVDLQTNSITDFRPQIDVSKVQILLVNNPICGETGTPQTYCSIAKSNDSYSTPPNNCVPIPCSLEQTLSPNCVCAYAYTGTLYFRAPSFSDLGNKTVFVTLESHLMKFFQSHEEPVDSVSLSNPRKKTDLELTLKIFPSGQDRFNRTRLSGIAFLLSNQTYKPPLMFGPYIFKADDYDDFAESVLEGPAKSSKSSNTGIIVGAVAGGSALLVLTLLACACALYQKKKSKRSTGKNNPFEKWDPEESSSSIPQLKGARRFTFEEIQNCTKNFSQVNNIGSGGYGKVYRGTLPNGQLIAVKRAQKESMQGGLEFKTEIELLSRVHHKNLVSLVGFCFDQGEQMLIYEYIANGTLKDTLSGKSGIRLDWVRRLKIALGTARGLDYLHELANPPIIHRDIKSTNILLDDRLNAKVSDFGLCKPLGAKGYITTQVKGTMGYLDPEYYMTQQLTEKSDVYSFGVLMLELITAKRPIERGKYIVKVVKSAIDKSKSLYGLEEILDPTIEPGTALSGFEKFVDVAMQCVEESSSDRPTMNYVVKEIENLLQLAGSNPILSASPSTSSSYYNNNASKESSLHPYDNEYFGSSVVIPRP
ncbi:hypothetical protein Fmac_009425 [Flemingia macrophylla]|uniref:non-specific serine/threonine protein kinase n=1 Tax=Flemingia macrophylla TaxID=520843 RepID=A0ABD1N081_9FABA